MYAARIHTVITGRHLSLDLPPNVPEGNAEILVLVEGDPPPAAMTLQQLSASIKAQKRPQRSAEDFARQIAEERAAWDDRP